jgi:hypothetical protein
MKTYVLSNDLIYIKYELNRDFLEKQISNNLFSVSSGVKEVGVKIGLEFEFYLNGSDGNCDENLDLLLKNCLSTFVNELMYIPTGCEKNKHKDVWYLEQDDSLKGDFGFELVSPLLDIESAKFHIEQVSDIINYLGYTTDDCGLHIHVSSGGGDLDINKLILFENDAKIFNQWERRGNYNKNIFDYFKITEPEVFRDNFKDLGRNYNYIQRFDGNCESGNHVELRCFGGDGYQDKSSEVLRNLSDFIDKAFIPACSAEMACDVYDRLMQEHIREFGLGFIKPIGFMDIKSEVDEFISKDELSTRKDVEDFIFGEKLPVLENSNRLVPIYKIYNELAGYLDNEENQNIFNQHRDNFVDGYVKSIEGVDRENVEGLEYV